MLIPIRCMSCGKPVAQLWEGYQKRVESGEEPKKVMDDLGLKKFCCRSLFLTHVDLLQQMSKFRR